MFAIFIFVLLFLFYKTADNFPPPSYIEPDFQRETYDYERSNIPHYSDYQGMRERSFDNVEEMMYREDRRGFFQGHRGRGGTRGRDMRPDRGRGRSRRGEGMYFGKCGVGRGERQHRGGQGEWMRGAPHGGFLRGRGNNRHWGGHGSRDKDLDNDQWPEKWLEKPAMIEFSAEGIFLFVFYFC